MLRIRHRIETKNNFAQLHGTPVKYKNIGSSGIIRVFFQGGVRGVVEQNCKLLHFYEFLSKIYD